MVCAGDWTSVRMWEPTGMSLTLKDTLWGEDMTEGKAERDAGIRHWNLKSTEPHSFVRMFNGLPWHKGIFGTNRIRGSRNRHKWCEVLKVEPGAEWRNIPILEKAATTMSTTWQECLGFINTSDDSCSIILMHSGVDGTALKKNTQ